MVKFQMKRIEERKDLIASLLHLSFKPFLNVWVKKKFVIILRILTFELRNDPILNRTSRVTHDSRPYHAQC
jgi:hypothetical protein